MVRPTKLRNCKRKFHHLVEGILSLFGIQFFARQQVVGDCADAQCVLACTCGISVQSCRFHFDSKYSTLFPVVCRRRMCRCSGCFLPCNEVPFP